VLRRAIENPLATALLEDRFTQARRVRVESAGDPTAPLAFVALP